MDKTMILITNGSLMRVEAALSILVLKTNERWIRGRVLDSRPRSRGFEPHRRHCVVSLSKTHLFLQSTGSTQEDQSQHN